MPYSIQFRFNTEAENQILNFAEIIEEEGILNPYKAHASIPHIALCVFEELNLENAIKIIDEIDFPKISINLSSIGSFPGNNNTLFFIPKIKYELLQIHEIVHSKFSENKTQLSYYDIHNWVPHCTVGIDIPNELYANAFVSLQKAFSPINAIIDKISITTFRPNVTLYEKDI